MNFKNRNSNNNSQDIRTQDTGFNLNDKSQAKPYNTVFSKLNLCNDLSEIDKERNKIKYLQNQLEKQTTLLDNQKSVCSKSQTKIEYKKSVQELYLKVSAIT